LAKRTQFLNLLYNRRVSEPIWWSPVFAERTQFSHAGSKAWLPDTSEFHGRGDGPGIICLFLPKTGQYIDD
jgi:hypothetical protein